MEEIDVARKKHNKLTIGVLLVAVAVLLTVALCCVVSSRAVTAGKDLQKQIDWLVQQLDEVRSSVNRGDIIMLRRVAALEDAVKENDVKIRAEMQTKIDDVFFGLPERLAAIEIDDVWERLLETEQNLAQMQEYIAQMQEFVDIMMNRFVALSAVVRDMKEEPAINPAPTLKKEFGGW